MQMRRVTFSDSDVHYTTHDVQHGTEATDGASSRQSAGSTGPPHAICRQFRRSAVSTLFSRPKSKKMKLSRISLQSPSTKSNWWPANWKISNLAPKNEIRILAPLARDTSHVLIGSNAGRSVNNEHVT